ncbi:hypothetical protein ACHAXS_007402 [Conticribra weissflogii]
MCNGNIPPPESQIQTPIGTTNPAAPALKTISKSELASHNSPRSAWCSIHSQVLDITAFSKTHPGGDTILLAAGKDATVLFETYHPRGVPQSLVKKLQIGVMEKGAFQDSFYSWDSEFYKVLKKRVIDRLDERGLSRRGSVEIWIKGILFLSGFWFSLYKMYVTPAFPAAVAWSVSMGIFAAMIGTCIQHDGNHGAFAKSNFINKLAGWTLDMIGASAFTWEVQHMLGHHPYTNILDSDEEVKKEKGIDCPLEEKDQVRHAIHNVFHSSSLKNPNCSIISENGPVSIGV